jgi:TonB family protein
MQSLRNTVLGLLGALLAIIWPLKPVMAQASQKASVDDSALSLAICPIVYPLDQTPSDRGFHYTFYGNGFFINNDGYLLTAAHVLSQLVDSTPYIVLRLPMAPPRFIKTEVIAIDRDHDVAVLGAIPNPFQGKYQVRFLRLSVELPPRMQAVLAAASRPSRLRDPHTFDAFTEDRPSGEVLQYEFSQLERGRPETELLLFSHEVLLGDSGAPVVSAETQAVVGLVEGRWLRPSTASLAVSTKQSNTGVGAVVPIHYAISLLQQHGVVWHPAHFDSSENFPVGPPRINPSLPVPLSLIAVPAPSQALQAGEVVLDARVDRTGQLSDIKVVQGIQPFVEKVLSAVRTWSFYPTLPDNQASQPRIGIIFQFASPGFSSGSAKAHHYGLPDIESNERSALPVRTTESGISANPQADSAVILAVQIDENGQVSEAQVVKDQEDLSPAVLSAIHQWQFTPAKNATINSKSLLVIVVIPRQASVPNHAQSTKQSRTLSQ